MLIKRTVADMETEMINAFPSKNGIIKKLSPAAIFEGGGIKSGSEEDPSWGIHYGIYRYKQQYE